MRKYYVTVKWPSPSEQPWMISIEARDRRHARALIEKDPQISDAGGRVTRVERAF